jgi:hypothetical protein
MDDVLGFALEQLTIDRKRIVVRHIESAASFAFWINTEGMLSDEYEVTSGLQELRSGAPIDIDAHQAVKELAAKAREAAEIFLTQDLGTV